MPVLLYACAELANIFLEVPVKHSLALASKLPAKIKKTADLIEK